MRWILHKDKEHSLKAGRPERTSILLDRYPATTQGQACPDPIVLQDGFGSRAASISAHMGIAYNFHSFYKYNLPDQYISSPFNDSEL